ncbi:hypothetical protein B0H34DRAFT_683802 [Crassisporium funariophilum]|nr:hypothetical protein B0H34DRAFT_683802 [Crassisporium funariophilum]
MGFCRRCGDIVAGARCKCGGTAVAPAVPWNRPEPRSNSQDRWSKTYVSSERSTSPVRNLTSDPMITTDKMNDVQSDVPSSPTKRRFPRPNSSSSVITLKNSVSNHIAVATNQSARPPSPLKYSTSLSDPEADILPSLGSHEPTLSKVYGSVLQPKDSLPLHSCAICSSIFPPDATIYPNPSRSQSKLESYLCRPCFTINGGSKGNCPSCSRPVLTLKAEGGFIHSGGNYWHKRCFNCAACFKNIGETPLVDLLGRPSCADCFDNCLKSNPSTPKKTRLSNQNSPISTNPGGLNANYGMKSQENSPAIEELEQRLGITKSRECSPALKDQSWKKSLGGSTSNSQSKSLSNRRDAQYNESPSPTRRYNESSPSHKVVPNMLSLQGERNLSPVSNTPALSPTLSPRRRPVSYGSNYERIRAGSDDRTINDKDADVFSQPKTDYCEFKSDVVLEDIFGTTTSPVRQQKGQTSHTTSPKATSNQIKSCNAQANLTTGISSLSHNVPLSTRCAKCNTKILNPREGGQFVTVPGVDENSSPQMYHPDCFKCAICDRSLNEAKKGQVAFVKCDAGPCHVQCAPTEQFSVQRTTTKTTCKSSPVMAGNSETPTVLSSKSYNSMLSNSSRFETPLQSSLSPTKPVFPRFGGQSTCPGCRKSVSLMERGVIPGPQGTRWHASCLVCGGKKEVTTGMLLGRGREEKRKGEPGCGKKLDSAAKSDGEGGVWCRECLLLLGVGGSPQTSPVRSPLIPSFTGTNRVAPQYTGTTTIARQFTGLGGSDMVLRQLTGRGLSPTRSISPTKQLGMFAPGNGSMRPRPKSVIGMRSTKSVDEGRGMYLVRQLTGATMTGGWGET